jgi:hypothetical protein
MQFRTSSLSSPRHIPRLIQFRQAESVRLNSPVLLDSCNESRAFALGATPSCEKLELAPPRHANALRLVLANTPVDRDVIKERATRMEAIVKNVMQIFGCIDCRWDPYPMVDEIMKAREDDPLRD